jgi:hypothetical protein
MAITELTSGIVDITEATAAAAHISATVRIPGIGDNVDGGAVTDSAVTTDSAPGTGAVIDLPWLWGSLCNEFDGNEPVSGPE